MMYLFFDIECANNFGGVGKICSFGYALCNPDFSVVESADLLMNPDAPFDWYLFKPGSKCALSHRREEYFAQPKFPHFYSKLRSLLESSGSLVVGFGSRNDVATIAAECFRYNLEPIDFSCADIRPALESHYGETGSLGAFVERLGIETRGKAFHDSRADAEFTMLVAKKLESDSGKPLPEIFKAFTPYKSGALLEELKSKLFKKWLSRQEAAKAANGKPRRIPKKPAVPEWFDCRRELLKELAAQGESARVD